MTVPALWLETAPQEKENGWPKVLDIYFENNDTVAFSWEEAITIEETGMYYLWFVICDDELSAATVRGQTTWKNPTGGRRRLLPPLLSVVSQTPVEMGPGPAQSRVCQAGFVQPNRTNNILRARMEAVPRD